MKNITRRDFIFGAGALAALKTWPAFGDSSKSAPVSINCRPVAKPDLKFGVVSDIHVREAFGQYGTETLLKAFKFFRECDVDAVAIAGDMADQGLVRQLQCVADAWNAVFARTNVEKLFIYGNHDIEGFKYSRLEASSGETIAFDRAGAWQRVFGEPYEPIWEKTVKGYTFIGAHWDSWSGVAAIEPYIAARAAKLGGAKPFFYIQHPHPMGTCHGDWAWGGDKGFATRALSRFPNAVAFSGHSHHPLTDERAFWRGSFTSIGCGSLRYIDPVYGRENSGPSALDEFKQMPMLDRFGGKEGLVVSVWGNRMAVQRRDFMYDENLGADWTNWEQATLSAPRFAAGAEVSIKGPYDGFDRKGRPVRQIKAVFPAAIAAEGVQRANDYAVAAIVRECGGERVAKMKRVYAPSCFLPPGRECETVECVFSLAELGTKSANYFTPVLRFAVQAADSSGRTSDALLSDWTKF